MIMPYYYYSLFLLFIINTFCVGQSDRTLEAPPPPELPKTEWTDSVIQTMTLDEKIGQLIMVPGYSNKDKAHEDELSALIDQYKVGGIIFFQGNPVDQARMTNRYQSESKLPLLIALDGEWGLEMRLNNTMRFPYQMTLGAIQDDSLIYEMGRVIAQHHKRVGIHVNFAPVIDINNNPRNPVINYRSFGEDRENVTAKGIMYMRGMQDERVIASAKHFPGHGDTDKDSHYTLPVITHDKDRLDSLELYPFRKLIEAGVKSVMVGHLNIPALDSTKNHVSSLSKPIVTGLLKEKMGYTGLITTDAMNMKGVADRMPPGEVDVQVLLAGNDLILMPVDVPKTVAAIKKAIREGVLTEEIIEDRCRKILEAKEWAGVNEFELIDTANMVADLNTAEAKLLNRRLLAASLTLLRNENQLLPIKGLDTLKVATIAIGTKSKNDFQKTVDKYVSATHFTLDNNSNREQINAIERQLSKYNLVLVSLHRQERRPGSTYGVGAEVASFIKKLSNRKNVGMILFRNAYLLSKYPDLDKADALVVAYQDGQVEQEVAAQAIFGALGMQGKLPVSASEHFKAGDGLFTKGGFRLGYAPPEAVGIGHLALNQIDTLASKAIKDAAMPGCVVLVAKDGQVIYNKAFGFHTYDSVQQVQPDDIYDLASITKIAAALPALMKLASEGKFDLDEPLSQYLKEFKKKDKRDITFRQVLAHQGGLVAWIPFWKNTVRKNGHYKWFTFKEDSSKRFPYKVADNLYLNRNYHRKIYRAIRKSPISETPKYVYSDLSFYLYPRLVEKLSGKPFLQYLDEEFYGPLGAETLTFNAYQKFSDERIVPTEYDSLFRNAQIHGRVHDEGAAMLDGVSGHAGLFGNANDLAKLLQMYVQDGRYAGTEYIDSATLTEFTHCQYCSEGNRRALGFDRPNVPYVENGNTAKGASEVSYGHSGFTGTFAWVDPKFNLIYVFLSNRVYPTRDNTLLFQQNVRTNIQQVIYDAI
jgi:beta-N-acetylhexosaminidase